MHVTFCGFPSMPVMVSLHRRALMRSLAYGWQCHEHPLSITDQQIWWDKLSLFAGFWLSRARPCLPFRIGRSRSLLRLSICLARLPAIRIGLMA